MLVLVIKALFRHSRKCWFKYLTILVIEKKKEKEKNFQMKRFLDLNKKCSPIVLNFESSFGEVIAN